MSPSTCPTNHPARSARTDSDVLVAYALHQSGPLPAAPVDWANWLHDAADELPIVPAEAWDGIADPDRAMWQADIKLRMAAEAISRDLAAGLGADHARAHLSRFPTGAPRHTNVLAATQALAVTR